MRWGLRCVGLAQINVHDNACALADQTVVSTELGREADSHTFVQRKYSVHMAGVVDVRGREQLVHQIAL